MIWKINAIRFLEKDAGMNLEETKLCPNCAHQGNVCDGTCHYPNAHLKEVGKLSAGRDIDECIQLAVDYGAKENSGAKVAKDTGKGAAVGAAGGAAVGAVTGNLGQGVAVGAAGGGAVAMTRSAINSGKPDPLFKKFVEQCLRDKGYQPVGWR
jgi:outer membrane lipoprotein SlyB